MVPTLAACTQEPFEVTLPYAVPSKFEASKQTTTPKVSQWWKRFASEELNRYMAVAADDNFDIAAAISRLEQSEQQAHIIRAALFPVIGYESSSVRSQSSGTTSPNVISSPRISTSLSRIVNASYILDVWGQNRDALRAALHTRDFSAYQVEVVRLTTRAAVVNDYLQYAADLERIMVAKENLANAERVLGVIRQRLAAGTAAALDVAQEESLVASQRAAIPSLRLAAETSRTALALLLGKPAQLIHPTIKSTRRLQLPKASPGMPSSLLLRRPDVRAAEEQMLAADANVDVARKAFLPTIQLTGDVGVQSAALSTLLRPESVVWSVAAGLTQPIFQGGKLRAQLALSEAQRQELLESYRKSILSALIDVENALIAIRENRVREEAQLVAVSTAQQALSLTEQRLREGTIDVTTVITAQNTLFQAQDLLIQIRLSRLQAIVSLFQAIGGDWDDR